MQFLSRTVSKAIEWCGRNGLIEGTDWECSSQVINIINYWFDVFNVRTEFDCKSHGFDLDFQNQQHILKKMSRFIKDMKVANHKKAFPISKRDISE